MEENKPALEINFTLKWTDCDVECLTEPYRSNITMIWMWSNKRLLFDQVELQLFKSNVWFDKTGTCQPSTK